jgi:CRISPR-associated exonuclease Cas4
VSDTWLIDVTDIKQYTCCPRLAYYRYCLPDIRPVTFTMEVGIQSHKQEEDREIRRSLKNYGIEQGDRLFHYPVISETLGIKGRIDLVVVAPSLTEKKEITVVEYKHSEQKAGLHFKLQLAAYALLLEEVFHTPVRRGFIYAIPLRKAEEVVMTSALRKRTVQTIQEIQRMLLGEQMPAATKAQQRCPLCEFRRFCNDVV